MTSNIKINLQFINDIINVKAKIKFRQEIKDFSFILNKDMEVNKILCDDNEISWLIEEEVQPQFRVVSNKFSIHSKKMINNVTIEYKGPVSGWANIIQDDKKALNMRSVWYPQRLSYSINKYLIEMKNLKDYIVIKGKYNKKEDSWLYEGNDYKRGNGNRICNIIALKKDKVFIRSSENCTIYWLDSNETDAAEISECYFEDVFDYFNNDLYYPKKVNKFDIISLSLEEPSGAVYRDERIICSRFNFYIDPNFDTSLRTKIAYLFAHELAHQWCIGAETKSWEDWLNETTAEWSALLYALEKENTELFDLIIKPKMKRRNELPPIKTKDGSRPDGVHDHGTLLFYDIYKEYGKDLIIKLLKIFVSLEHKNTENFLTEVEKRIDKKIALFIKKSLTRNGSEC